jgi:hypothetical protein
MGDCGFQGFFLRVKLFWYAAWPDGTTRSDLAPSKCELQYGTTPSLEFGESPSLIWRASLAQRNLCLSSKGPHESV